MKNIIFIFPILLTVSVLAQNDSSFIFGPGKLNLSYYVKHESKYKLTNEIKRIYERVEMNNVKTLELLKNDSALIRIGLWDSVRFHIDDLNTLEINKGSNLLSGVVAGGIIGGGIGLFIGVAAKVLFEGVPTGFIFSSTAVVGLIGGAIGALIGSASSDYSLLDLYSISHDKKESELIRFLKKHN